MVKYILDYYGILNIDETANKKTIEKAYKRAIVKYKSKSGEMDKQKCKYVKDAYLVLSDDERRAKYDLLRKQAKMNSKDKKSDDYDDVKENADKIKDILSDMNKRSGRGSKFVSSSAKAMKGKSMMGGGSKLLSGTGSKMLFGNGAKLLVGGAIAGYGAKKGRDFIRGRGKNKTNE